MMMLRPWAYTVVGGAIAFAATLALVTARAQLDTDSDQERTGSLSGAAGGSSGHAGTDAETIRAACHGADGNNTDPRYPKLAGQGEKYLYRQLWAFKRGTRKSEIMSGIVAGLSENQITGAAAFYSRQVRQPDQVRDPRLATLGQQVFFSGMPPCSMCHSSSGQAGMMGHGMMRDMPMMGMMGSAPRLKGQHAAYILDQLNRFARGERQAMMMGQIAASLSETEKRAIAEYLSGLP
jgi:cytochrome c553